MTNDRLWSVGIFLGLVVGACDVPDGPQMPVAIGGTEPFNDDGAGPGPGPGPGPTAGQTTLPPASGTSGASGSVPPATGDGGVTGSLTTYASTAFDTLTTAPNPNTPVDPTNTSADTNDTGLATVTLLPENIIDDLEDGDSVLYERGGRIGIWYTYDDATPGQLNPPAGGLFVTTPGGPNGSLYAAHVRGGGHSGFGAGVGFDINNVGGTIKRPVDASMYNGIAFQARGTGVVRFMVQTAGVVPTLEGGTCTAGADCNNAFGLQFTLTPTWQQIVVPFAMMEQDPYWGYQVPQGFESNLILGFQWAISTSAEANGTPLPPFEIAIDDVGFY